MSLDTITSLLGNVWSIAMIVLFFGGSIFVHELGHFLAARRRGVKVDRFSIGFGPKIASWERDGVEYRLSWLPLGGYVALPQLADMATIEGESDVEIEKLPPVSYSTRMIVFAAGAFFNLLFAFALATILWIAGQETSEDLATTRIGYISQTITLPDGKSVPSPAAIAGLKIGDTIRALDGNTVNDWTELLQMLTTSAGVTDDGRRRAVFTIERDGRSMDITLNPIISGENKDRKVGILAAYTPIVANVPDNSYAHKIGLRVEDRLIAIDGVPLLNLITLYDVLQEKSPRAFALKVSRGTQTIEITVPAERPKDASPFLGAGFRTATGMLYQNPVQQISGHVRMTGRVLWSLLQPHSDIGISKLAGPVGIGRIFWQASEVGIRWVIFVAILVNVNLAIFNLLPIPVLDGGHMLFATIGKLRGRALSPNFLIGAQSVFVVLMFSMIIYVTVFGDIRRWMRDVKADAQAKEAVAEQQKKAAPAKP